MTTCTPLISIQLTRPLFPDESITNAAIVGRENIIQNFMLNATSLFICNSVALSPGRYEFSVVMIISGRALIAASAIIDVLSPGKFCNLKI